jgi:hypothetical protein
MEVVAAPLAGIGPLGFDPIPVGRPLALGALETLPEADLKKVTEAAFVVRELAEESGDGEGLLAHAP